MSQESNFGRLFRKRAFGDQEPIENYVSEALAITIEHDDGPMRRALKAIAWPKRNSPPFDPEHVTKISPRTQQFLSAFDIARDGTLERIRCGYLDLVLDLMFANGSMATAWVEVKVDTGEHGEQLDVYANHASRLQSPPHIFTISKSEVRPVERHPPNVDIGWLSWKDLASVIEQTPGADNRWDDLLSFLTEEGIAWRSLRIDRVDPDAHVDVLIEVNRQIRARWPSAEMDYLPQALRRVAKNNLEASGRLVVTAGPVTYGLVPLRDDLFWRITVGSANWQRVRLDAVEIVRQADSAGLSDRWQRSTLRTAVLALEVPLRDYASYEAATKWFLDALDELNTKAILNTYLDGLAAKRRTSGPPEDSDTDVAGSDEPAP